MRGREIGQASVGSPSRIASCDLPGSCANAAQASVKAAAARARSCSLIAIPPLPTGSLSAVWARTGQYVLRSDKYRMTQAASRRCGDLIFGIPDFLACHKSYASCCASHISARPPCSTPSHASRRSAICGEMGVRSLNTRDKVLRDTPSCSAAPVMLIASAGSTSSRSVAPGCGGLCMVFMPLMIVLIIDQDRMFFFKPKRQTPVSADGDCMMVYQFSGKRMQFPAVDIHVVDHPGIIQSRQLPRQFSGMARLYSCLASCFKERLQAFMAECLDHSSAYSAAFGSSN